MEVEDLRIDWNGMVELIKTKRPIHKRELIKFINPDLSARQRDALLYRAITNLSFMLPICDYDEKCIMMI